MTNNSRRAFWIVLALTGCSTLGTIQPSGLPVSEAYHGKGGNTLRIAEESSPFSARQPVAVLSQPEVFAVYAPSRLDRARDVLVGEHWIFLKLKDAEWFTERAQAPEPAPLQGTAPDSELQPLRRMKWGE